MPKDQSTIQAQQSPKDEPVLQPGEWYLCCSECDWRLEKMTAAQNKCPECGAALKIISRKKDKGD
jgi:rRNA maturation endonuclease Nob1